MKKTNKIVSVILALVMVFPMLTAIQVSALSGMITTASAVSVLDYYSGGKLEDKPAGTSFSLIAESNTALTSHGRGNPFLSNGVVYFAVSYNNTIGSVNSASVNFTRSYVQTKVTTPLYDYYSGASRGNVLSGQKLVLVSTSDSYLTGQGRGNPFTANGIQYYAVEVRGAGTNGVIASVKASDVQFYNVSSTKVYPVVGSSSVSQSYNQGIHNGIDITASATREIVAYKAGTVVYTYNGCNHVSAGKGNCSHNQGTGFGGYGNCVLIDHGDGYFSFYAHLSQNSIVVSKGVAVAVGQKLGMMGSSGSSTGLHLHFEIRNGNYPTTMYHLMTVCNPNNFLPA